MTGLAEKTFMDEVRVDVAADPGVSGYEEAAGQIAARTLGILGEKASSRSSSSAMSAWRN